MYTIYYSQGTRRIWLIILHAWVAQHIEALSLILVVTSCALLIYTQEQLHLVELLLAKELDKSGSIMWPALALRLGLLIALLMHLDLTTVSTLKMLEFDATLQVI